MLFSVLPLSLLLRLILLVCLHHSLPALSTSYCRKSRFRAFDGLCTGHRPKYYSAGRPQPRLSRLVAPLSHLSARALSLILHGKSPRSRAWRSALSPPSYGQRRQKLMTEFAVLFSQFVDHDIVFTPQNTSRPHPIPVPAYDPYFRTLSVLPFHNSSRVKGSSLSGSPANMNSAALDLSQVYGSSRKTNAELMGMNGMFRHSFPGDYLGMKGPFFKSGDGRVNEHPILVAFHTLFSREHNRQAALLKRAYPKWPHTRIFEVARERNIATYQRIVYEEFLPAFLGERVPYRGYKKNVDGSPSVEFTTAGFRVGHGMINGQFNFGAKSINLKDLFFQPASLFKKRGGIDRHFAETFIRPTLPAGFHVANAFRNGLFEFSNKRGQGQIAVDLAANNIQRGRDHRLPSLNQLRAALGLKRYDKMWKIGGLRMMARLKKAYGKADNVELWPGLLVENVEKDHVLGETTRRLWKKEFARIAAGDKRWYTRNPFVSKIELPSMKEIMRLNSGISNKNVVFNSVWVYTRSTWK